MKYLLVDCAIGDVWPACLSSDGDENLPSATRIIWFDWGWMWVMGTLLPGVILGGLSLKKVWYLLIGTIFFQFWKLKYGTTWLCSLSFVSFSVSANLTSPEILTQFSSFLVFDRQFGSSPLDPIQSWKLAICGEFQEDYGRRCKTITERSVLL